MECGESYDSLKQLHAHIKKHGMFLGDYYVKNFKRKNKLTAQLLQFKNYEEYFSKDFETYAELIKWCDSSKPEEVKEYILDLLRKRINKKELKYGPSTIDLFTSNLPPMRIYKQHFASYSEVCSKLGIGAMFPSNIPASFYDDYNDVEIYIDTREQQPLKFKNSQPLKLDVGDYAVSGDDYDYTFVDRKSFADFCSTMTVGHKRFARELQRCRDLGCYLFVVTECDLYSMDKLNAKSAKRYNLEYAFHLMKEFQRDYSDCCQFVFSGNRLNSELLIPKLLVNGKKLWKTDIQYFLDRGVLNNTKI